MTYFTAAWLVDKQADNLFARSNSLRHYLAGLQLHKPCCRLVIKKGLTRASIDKYMLQAKERPHKEVCPGQQSSRLHQSPNLIAANSASKSSARRTPSTAT